MYNTCIQSDIFIICILQSVSTFTVYKGKLDLQLQCTQNVPVQSVPITIKVVNSNPAQARYNIM
jgi:hypothetical protein